MGLGVDRDPRHAPAHFARQRIEVADVLHFVVEQLHPNRFALRFGRKHIEGVAPHPEGALPEFRFVARVLQVGQTHQQVALIDPVAAHQVQDHLKVGVRIAQSVDRRHRRHHDGVLALHQRLGGGQPHLFDMAVDGGVLLDIRVGGGHIGFGLVVVVVRDEILHPVAGKEIPELAVKLRGQRLVGGQNQRRALLAGHHAGQRIGLPRAGHSQKRLPRQALLQPLAQPIHRLRLIAGQAKVRLQLKPILRHPRTLAPLPAWGR